MFALLLSMHLQWSGIANAQDIDAWGALQDAQLAESIDGNLSSAMATYEQLMKRLHIDDPVRGDALYAYARAAWMLGDDARARQVLLQGIRTGTCDVPCRDLLERIDFEAYAVASLPVRWTFQGSEHGLFHPWRLDEYGALRVSPAQEDGNRVLIWSSASNPQRQDRLMIGLALPDQQPKTFKLNVSSKLSNAWIQLAAFDQNGLEYRSGGSGLEVPTGRAMSVQFDLEGLSPRGGGTPTETPHFVRLELLETSSLEGGTDGPNELYLDDVEIF